MREGFIYNPEAMIVRLDCLYSFSLLAYILVLLFWFERNFGGKKDHLSVVLVFFLTVKRQD